MSSQAVAWAIVMQAGGPSAKAVLMSIANYSDAYGECWQDQKTLAEGAEIKERQFRTILNGLIDKGLVERARRGGRGKGRLTDILRLRMRELPAILTAKRREESCENSDEGQPATGQFGRKQPAISGNRQRLPLAPQPAKIAERATGKFQQSNRQLIAGALDNPTKNPTTPYSPPGFDEAWALWPKHHRQSSKQTSIDRWRKLAAEPELKLAAVRAYLASPDARKTTPDGVVGGFVNAFEVWLNRYAEFWLERCQSSTTSPNIEIDWADHLAYWREHHVWNEGLLGPAPDQPGYRGPAIDEPPTDLFAAGARQ